MIKSMVTGILGVGLWFFLLTLWAQSSSCEEDVYGKIVPVGGIVTTTEIESGETKRSRKKTIILRRVDCKKCISSVTTDDEGKYIAYLSEGRYQIIIRDCGRDRKEDCMAPNQSHFIDVILKGYPQFDIKLIHSKEDSVMELPNGIIPPSSAQ